MKVTCSQQFRVSKDCRYPGNNRNALTYFYLPPWLPVIFFSHGLPPLSVAPDNCYHSLLHHLWLCSVISWICCYITPVLNKPGDLFVQKVHTHQNLLRTCFRAHARMYKERVKCAASNFLPGQRILLQLLVRWQHLLVILVTGTISYEHRWMERAQIGVENTVVRVLLEDVANKKEN